MTTEYNWSDWLDFTKEDIDKVPDSPGVFMMHVSMKVLFINNSDNLRSGLKSSKVIPCIAEAKRFRFMMTEDHEKIKKNLIEDYKNRHEGKLPKCMSD